MNVTEKTDLAAIEAPTDAAELAHIIDCPDDKESAAAWLTEARVFGLEVTALCGYTWVPTRDPGKLYVCEACLDIAQIRVAL